MHPNPEPQARLTKATGEARRVQHGDAVAVENAAEVRRGVDPGPHLRPAEPIQLTSRGSRDGREVLELADLPGLGGDGQLTRALPRAVDAVVGGEGDETKRATIFPNIRSGTR